MSSPEDSATIVLGMIEQLDLGAVCELERALALHLHSPDDPAHRRWQRLGALALMLREAPARGLAFPMIERAHYERHAPPEAPGAQGLVAEFGSWQDVCRAAGGLLEDGRWRGEALPWTNGMRERPRPAPYTRQECRHAIARCARELTCIPTSNRYITWVNAARRAARQRGQHPRLPTITTIYRLYPTWADALAHAGIDPEEIAAARTDRVPRADTTQLPADPRQRLAELPADRIAALGLTPAQAGRMRRRGFRQLPLSQALALANALGGSLEWLAGHTENPANPAPADGRLDTEAVREARQRCEVTEATLRSVCGVSAPVWRRIMRGQTELTLGQLLALAAALETQPLALVSEDGR